MVRKVLNEFRVGLFVAAGLFLAMAIIFSIGGEHRLFESYYSLYASFENISGLRVGAPVQLAGLKVGVVDKIRIPKALDNKKITVDLHILKRYQDRIREDSLATVETQGLLGDKFIFISVGSEAQPMIPDKGILPTKETTSIFSLAEKAGSIMDEIGDASESIKEMLSSVKGTKGEGDIKAIVSSARKTIEQVEKGKGLLHGMIYDPKGDDVVSNLSNALKAASDIAGGVEKDIKGRRGGMIGNLREASADIRDIAASIKSGQGTLGKLVNDPSLYDELRALMGHLNRNNLLKAVIRSTIRENDKQVLKDQ